MTTAEELKLKFGKPRIVMTKRGEREVCNAPATEEFWTAWRAGKDALRNAGYSVSKTDSGEWQVAKWSETMSVSDRRAAQEASRAQDAEIAIPVPDGMMLMPFQRAGVAYALAREGSLIGDEMGLGKTVQAIAFANTVGAKRILVVAPASLLLNWRNEIARWQVNDLPVHIIRPGTTLNPAVKGWVVVNYDIVSRYEAQLKSESWDVAIYDECQYLKTRSAKRTLVLLGGGRGEDKKEPVPAKRKLLLTGTPIMNRPAELYPSLHYLDPKRWATWTGFAKRYCQGGMGRFGYDASGASNLDELNMRLRETVMVRRLKADVLTELPAKRRQIVTLELDGAEAQEIVRLENEVFERTEAELAAATYEMQKAEAEGDESAYNSAVAKLKAAQGIAFAEMSRVRHETAVAKLPAVIEHLKSIESKCIVFAHHHDVIRGLIEALADKGVVSITGETPNEKRQPIVEKFQGDSGTQFFVGNIKAAGVGLTLTASSHVVFAELDWTPAAVSQAEDRAHRIGQRESVLVQHLVIDGSLDAKMAKTIIAKQKIIDQALDKKVEIVEAEVSLIPIEAEVAKQPPKAIVIQDLSDEKIKAVHSALRIVAAYDADRARNINGVGFSKMDTQFGCELAARSRLTSRQAAAAMKMVRKYRRQYPVELYEQMFGEMENA